MRSWFRRRPKPLRASPYRIAELEYELGFTDEKPQPPVRFGPGVVIPYYGRPPVYIEEKAIAWELGRISGA